MKHEFDDEFKNELELEKQSNRMHLWQEIFSCRIQQCYVDGIIGQSAIELSSNAADSALHEFNKRFN